MVKPNRNYIIIKSCKHRVWVIIKTYCDTSDFRRDLEHDIEQLGITSAYIYFDFVVQTGRYNRFLQGIYKNRRIADGIHPLADDVIEIRSIFNSFLALHKELIYGSMLSAREKNNILQELYKCH